MTHDCVPADDLPYQVILDEITGIEHVRQFYLRLPSGALANGDSLQLEIWDVLAWMAYCLEVPSSESSVNRSLACTLRAIACEFYEPINDERENLAFELDEKGASAGEVTKVLRTIRYARYRPVRHIEVLALDGDGRASINVESLAAARAAEQIVGSASEANYPRTAVIDFPARAHEKYGVRGVVVSVRDLLLGAAHTAEIGGDGSAPDIRWATTLRGIVATHYNDRDAEIEENHRRLERWRAAETWQEEHRGSSGSAGADDILRELEALAD